MRQQTWWMPLLLSLALQTALPRDGGSVDAASAEDAKVAEAAETLGLSLDKRPHLAGIRIEPLDEKESTFAGYTYVPAIIHST